MLKKRKKNIFFVCLFPQKKWFLTWNLETETYSEKKNAVWPFTFEPGVAPFQLTFLLICTRYQHSWGIPYLSKSHVCGHCGPWTCFHHSPVAQCNGIKSIQFFNKGGIPLAKTTLNMTLNQPESYQNVPIIFSSPTQPSTQPYLSLRN